MDPDGADRTSLRTTFKRCARIKADGSTRLFGGGDGDAVDGNNDCLTNRAGVMDAGGDGEGEGEGRCMVATGANTEGEEAGCERKTRVLPATALVGRGSPALVPALVGRLAAIGCALALTRVGAWAWAWSYRKDVADTAGAPKRDGDSVCTKGEGESEVGMW